MRIKEYRNSISTGGDMVKIHIENTVNYGEDFIETEDFEISQAVFDQLIKD
jgi:hypothetical protein